MCSGASTTVLPASAPGASVGRICGDLGESAIGADNKIAGQVTADGVSIGFESAVLEEAGDDEAGTEDTAELGLHGVAEMEHLTGRAAGGCLRR